MFQLKGFDSIKHSEVRYISVADALKNFKYLYEYSQEFYVRKEQTLTEEQLNRYEMMLTVPKNEESFYIRVMHPFLVWEYEGGLYLVNGNSRFAAIRHLKSRSDAAALEFAPIPYVLLSGDLTKSIAERIQYDANDTTRKNSSIERFRRIQAFLNDAVAAGMKHSKAKAYVCEYFGISKQTMSNVNALFNKPIPQLLESLLDEELATTDAAVKVIQASDALNVSAETIIGEVIAGHKSGKLTASGVTGWRERFVKDEKNADKPEVIIDNYVNEPEKNGRKLNLEQGTESLFSNKGVMLKDFSEEDEVQEPELPTITKNEITFEDTKPEQTVLMMRIASSVLSEMPEEDAARFHETVKKLLESLLANSEPSPELLSKIKNNLGI